MRLPDPKAVALLGTALLLRVRTPSKTVEYTFDGDGLLWSPFSRGLYIFPGMRFSDWKELASGTVTRDRRLDMQETYRALGLDAKMLPAARLFAAWAARPSTRYTSRSIERYPLQRCGAGVTIDYRSDKWNGRGGEAVNYTHALSSTGSDTVYVHEKVIFVKGPRLTVNDRGIVY